MSNKSTKTESPVISLKNESARQRWELFHRAIAHAKQTNDDALLETGESVRETKNPVPLLSIVR
jgi:hypothetical protein